MNEINEYRAIKEGKATPKYLIDELQREYEQGNIKHIAVVISNGDTINTAWSAMDNTKAIGLLECGKREMLDDMYDWE